MARLYLPGGPPRGAAAEVTYSPGGVVVSSGGITSTWPWDDLDLRFAGFEDGLVALCRAPRDGSPEVWVDRSDLEAIAALGDALPSPFRARLATLTETGQRSRLTGMVLRITGLTAFAGVTLWAVRGGLTAMALAGMPWSVDTTLGGLLADSMAAEITPCGDPVLVAEVQRMADALEAQMPERPFPIQVTVTTDPSINASALPGGHLWLNAGLLAEAGSADEVASVIGHEIGHAVERHGLRTLLRDAGLAAAVTALVGDPSTAGAALAVYGSNLASLAFSRDQEHVADTFGVTLMHRAGFDPHAAATFHGRLAEDETSMAVAAALLSTHPSGAARVASLTAQAEALAPHARAPREDEAWTSIRERCGPADDSQ